MHIRNFTGADFQPISNVLGTTWHAEHGSHAYWQGADELCAHLARTDHGLVAEDEDASFLGVILLASPNGEDRNETLRMHWLQQRTRIAAMASALGIDARADVAVLNEETALMEEAARALGGNAVGEAVLLIVAPEARGRGVGRALLDAGVAWLADHDADTLRLVTDDHCDWQVYEHVGMRRVLERNDVYVYQQDLAEWHADRVG